MKRKLIALLLALTLCLPLTVPAGAAGEEWYSGAVQWAQERGMITAEADADEAVTAEELSAMMSALTGGERTGDSEALTRIEAVRMLSEALSAQLPTVTWHPFTDSDASETALSWAWMDGVVLGVGGSAFAPEAPCTRAQAVTMLWRWVLRHPDYALSSVYTIDSQSIGLAGIGNARELGGYVMQDGRTVKRGVLLRTAKPADGTEEDLKKLVEVYHLAELADFRMESEVTQAPEPELEGVVNRWLPIMDMELLAHRSADMMKSLQEKGVDYAAADSVTKLLAAVDSGIVSENMYVEFLSGKAGKENYRKLFEDLLALPEGQSLLFHCTQGKDRTGVASMLILSALGADEETIMRDYLLTNDFNSRKIAGERKMLSESGIPAEKLDRYLIAMDGVNPVLMKNALRWLEENYGGAAGYLTQELGLDEARITLLRDKFLETPAA